MKTREIKFRAWDKDHKTMEYTVCFNYEDGVISNVYFRGDEDYAIENPIIMQFTGLKDKNGQEIYEGDIIRFWADGKARIGKLVWSEEMIGWEIQSSYCELMLSSDDTLTVLGNIYENPELIK